jgi:solute carrier family 35 protein E1
MNNDIPFKESHPPNAHAPGWGLDTSLHTITLGDDNKYSSKSSIPNLGAVIANVKKLLQRYWLSQRRTSRSHLTSANPSLTSATPPSSTIVFILLCSLWYTTSALSSNTGKAILTQFRYPVTLTFIQFGFVAGYCLLFMSPIIRFSRLRMPTRAILHNTLPMGMFQVVGHMFSSIAISRIPVSTVHTIKVGSKSLSHLSGPHHARKALSPLFTVAAYALLFGVSYSTKTYLSLLPLTVGVMLACSFDVSASNAVGLLCAFGSALVFVSSNIFFKKIMPSNTGGLSQDSSHKLDKLNLLLYSSGMAFVLMIPLWVYYDLPLFISATSNPAHITHPKEGHSTPHSVTYYFFMNGTVHFAQNIIAFVILSSTSPVTYSIASLIKRVAVICIAIVWFNQAVHLIQALGIILTFTGLYMYNSAKSDVEKGEKKMRRVEAARDLMLPMTKTDSQLMTDTDNCDVVVAESTARSPYALSRNGSTTTTSHYHHPAVTTHHHHHVHAANKLSTLASPGPNTKLSTIENAETTGETSYPSPPPSIDSPPLSTIPLGHAESAQQNAWHRQTVPEPILVS